MPTEVIHQQRDGSSAKESRHLTATLEDKAVVKICMRSYTELRIGNIQSSIRFEHLFLYLSLFFYRHFKTTFIVVVSFLNSLLI